MSKSAFSPYLSYYNSIAARYLTMSMFDRLYTTKKRKFANFDEFVSQDNIENIVTSQSDSVPPIISLKKIDVIVMMANTMGAQSQSFRKICNWCNNCISRLLPACLALRTC